MLKIALLITNFSFSKFSVFWCIYTLNVVHLEVNGGHLYIWWYRRKLIDLNLTVCNSNSEHIHTYIKIYLMGLTLTKLKPSAKFNSAQTFWLYCILYV